MTARLKRKVAAVVIFSVLYFAFYGFNNYDERDDEDWYIHKLEHPLPKLEAEVLVNARKRNIQFKSVRCKKN